MHLSDKALNSKPSATMALIALSAELASQGRTISALVAGEPDYPTPSNICMAGIHAITSGDTKYGAANGSHALRQAISDKLLQDNGLTYLASQILVASGTKPLLFAACTALCNPGDEVIVPAPYWVSYPSIVEISGAKPVEVACPESDGFKLTASRLEAAITPKTRALILNTPNNPTGAVYTEEEQRLLLEVLVRNPHVYLITDEIYEHLVYDGQKHVSPAFLAPQLMDRILLINGFSKGYGMIGWRLGFAAGPKALISAMSAFLSHILGASSNISQAAAIEALQGPQPYIAENRIAYQQRRDLCLERINAIEGLACAKPGGSFFLYIGCSALFGKTTPKGTLIDSSVAFCHALLEETGVAVVPGEAFGLPAYFRLSYSVEIPALENACLLLAQFCASLQ